MRALFARHPEELQRVQSKSSISTNDIAAAVSNMAINPAVARDLIATSLECPIEEVATGFRMAMAAALIAARTIAAHDPAAIGELLFDAVAPGFTGSTGYIN